MKTYPIRAILKHISKDCIRQIQKDKTKELDYFIDGVSQLHKYGLHGSNVDIMDILKTKIKNKIIRRIGNAAKKRGVVVPLKHLLLIYKNGGDYRCAKFYSPEKKIKYFKKVSIEILEVEEYADRVKCNVFHEEKRIQIPFPTTKTPKRLVWTNLKL